MITKAQLNKLTYMTGLSLYQQEKDYLLKLFLAYYYKKYEDLVFKGGTCLKYVFGLPRFSEDLDFYAKNVKRLKDQVRAVLKQIEQIGIPNALLKEEVFTDAYTCEIEFQGPLYAGTAQTRNKFRIDAGYRTGIINGPAWKAIKSEYPETEENILALCMDNEEMLCEKIIACFQRKKGRDLYDVWFLLSAGINLNKQMLESKKRKEGEAVIKQEKIVSEEDYIRDMKRLVKKMIPYSQVKKEVLEALKKGGIITEVANEKT